VDEGLRLVPGDSLLAAVTLAELQVGVFRAEDDRQRERAGTFIQSVEALFEVVPFGREEARAWATIQDNLRRRGEPIGERDLQIAATALAGGHSVMTGNVAEFSRVPGLEVIAPPDIPPPR